MKTERNRTTNHFRNDRLDRAAYIAQYIGFGEVVKQSYRADTDTFQQITDTGIIIARNRKNVIVTMYIANINQVRAIYKDENIPSWLAAKVKKNAAKYLKNQPI